jgi:hypothetical protein
MKKKIREFLDEHEAIIYSSLGIIIGIAALAIIIVAHNKAVY